MGVLAPRHEDAFVIVCSEWSQSFTNAKDFVTGNSALESASTQPGMEEVLPFHIQVEILNRVKDARDLANCMATSKAMYQAVQSVQSVNLICLNKYYKLARERILIKSQISNSDEEDEDTDSDDSDEGSDEGEDCCGRAAPPRDAQVPMVRQERSLNVSFKAACLSILRHANAVEQLRMEIEPEMQGNPFQKDEIHMVDFWLSEPMFARKWVSLCSQTLQHLSIADYGQQAIMRQSPIVRILSENCKSLKTLELRNMYLDTCDLEEFPKLTSLTLRCIKMTEKGLADINAGMPALENLALVSVFGIQEAKFSSRRMRVLCLGLSTKAKVVDLDLPNVHKLQIKMSCPDLLRVCAPNLAYVAVCMEKRDGATVEFEKVTSLKELLFGASHFWTLSKLIKSNPALEKVFLDVPCMALGEDGKWEGVLHQVPLRLPDMRALGDSCPALHTLSIGPGLWHSMERDYETKKELTKVEKWPVLSRLIVHMIVQSLDTCLKVLRWLISALPSIQTLEIYVHSDSPVEPRHFLSGCQEQIAHTTFKSGTWKKSLCFACFSF